MVQILNGLQEAKLLTDNLKEKITSYHQSGIYPKLAIVLVGDNPASHIYIRNKQKKADEIGIQTDLHCLPSDTNQKGLHGLLEDLNKDSHIHGILLQLPLPSHLDSLSALSVISPHKDVDGLNPINAGFLSMNRPRFIPCTPQGCLHLIRLWKQNLKALKAVVLGRSSLVGKPIAQLLLRENCTVTLAHSHSKNLEDICKQADILVAAVGSEHLVKQSWIKPGACVIDVGINSLDDSCTGDVDFQGVSAIAGAISPVPGGVGPLTVMFLMWNTLKAVEIQEHLKKP